jgi:hypothetical protein
MKQEILSYELQQNKRWEVVLKNDEGFLSELHTIVVASSG